MSEITLHRDDALSADALALIGESEAELSALYPPEVRFAFSPEQLVEASVAFVTAYRAGRPSGCGGVALLDGYGELKRIFVTKAARGSGVSEAVVRELETIALNSNRALIRLETGEASPEAIRFYTRLGYNRRGPFGAYEENGSSVFMEKSL